MTDGEQIKRTGVGKSKTEVDERDGFLSKKASPNINSTLTLTLPWLAICYHTNLLQHIIKLDSLNEARYRFLSPPAQSKVASLLFPCARGDMLGLCPRI